MKIILFTLFSLNLLAQTLSSTDFDNSDPQLDEFYQRGSYLVYDCNTDHWVCTKKLEFNRCKIQRKKALLEYKDRLPCSFFDEYKTNILCVKEQIRLTNEARGDRFCLHPSQKGLKRDF